MVNVERSLDQLDAVAISAGPGSYTGLRIGTSTAKGLAFALEVPMIAVSSLDSMFQQIAGAVPAEAILIPMIDARRMEVFCLARRASGEQLWEPRPLIVDQQTFDAFEKEQIFFFGNGADKFNQMFSEVVFIADVHPSAQHMGRLAFEKFKKKDFEDLAYFEPDYLKEYRTNVPSQKFKV